MAVVELGLRAVLERQRHARVLALGRGDRAVVMALMRRRRLVARIVGGRVARREGLLVGVLALLRAGRDPGLAVRVGVALVDVLAQLVGQRLAESGLRVGQR